MTDRNDARTTRIELTQRVRAFDEPPMVQRTTAMLADAFAGLTPEQTRDLLALMRRWLAGLVTPTVAEE